MQYLGLGFKLDWIRITGGKFSLNYYSSDYSSGLGLLDFSYSKAFFPLLQSITTFFGLGAGIVDYRSGSAQDSYFDSIKSIGNVYYITSIYFNPKSLSYFYEGHRIGINGYIEHKKSFITHSRFSQISIGLSLNYGFKNK